MRVIYKKLIDCSGMPAVACSDLCLVALGHGPAFSLRANLPNEVVHGAVTIAHNSPPEPHEIWVDVYEQDEPPTEEHKSTLKRPVPMPTERQIKSKLATWQIP